MCVSDFIVFVATQHSLALHRIPYINCTQKSIHNTYEHQACIIHSIGSFSLRHVQTPVKVLALLLISFFFRFFFPFSFLFFSFCFFFYLVYNQHARRRVCREIDFRLRLSSKTDKYVDILPLEFDVIYFGSSLGWMRKCRHSYIWRRIYNFFLLCSFFLFPSHCWEKILLFAFSQCDISSASFNSCFTYIW